MLGPLALTQLGEVTAHLSLEGPSHSINTCGLRWAKEPLLHLGKEHDCVIKFDDEDNPASPDVCEPWGDVFCPEEGSEWQNVMKGSQNYLAASHLHSSPGSPLGAHRSPGCQSEAGR